MLNPVPIENPAPDIDIAKMTTVEVKKRINDYLFEQSEGEVQNGPFKGMKMLDEHSWDDGNLGTKILGCYEQELHPIIEEEVKRLLDYDCPHVVNIGCAEGYYAVGLARRLPLADVWIIDKEEALEIALRAAALNDVCLIASAMLDDVFRAPHLVVCDCEGAEVKYLDKEVFPALVGCSIVVECHDFKHQPTTQILLDRFVGTHAIWVVEESWRNPNQFHMLCPWHSHARWMAVSEGRPAMMRWLYMKPKEQGAA